MRLDRAQAALHPLPPWQAIDFGLALARRWWRPMIAAWLAIVVSIQLLLYVAFSALPEEQAGLALALLVLVWWLKPLFERVILHVLSRRLFGSAPATAEVLRAVPGLWKKRLWASLVRYRFDPARSFLAPIADLEAPTSAALSARRQVIGRGGGNEASWLTATFVVFDLMLQVSVLGLLAWVWPNDPASEMGRWASAPWDLDLMPDAVANLWLYLAIVTQAITQPFYVAAGFGLYLSRRARLEGWDIEVQFRSIERRMARLAVLVALSLASAAVVAMPTTAFAEEAVDEPSAATVVQVRAASLDDAARAQVQAAVARVKDELVLGKTVEKSGWRLRWRPEPSPSSSRSGPSLIGPAVSFFFGPLLSWLLWAVLGLTIAFLVARLWLSAARAQRHDEDKVVIAQPTVGKIARPSVPLRQVPQKARELAEAGEIAASLALLYRASVQRLVGTYGAKLADGATEYECQGAARRFLDADGSQYFSELSGAWQRTAYAQRPSPREQTLDLCARWQSAFSDAP